MTKITIVSGFLGAGKTTLIKKLIADGFAGEKLVLIENEFGEIGIDSGFLQEAGVQVTEMNSGCICCSLVGDFRKALQQVLADYAPDRILIEPSGVGKLSDVIAAVRRLNTGAENTVVLTGFAAVADATKCRSYLKNFGEFYADQIKNASAILLSRTAGLAPEKLAEAVALLRTQNADAPIVTTPWNTLAGEQIIAAIERENTLAAAVEALAQKTAQEHTPARKQGRGCGCGQGRGQGKNLADGEACGCGGHGGHNHLAHADGEACGCGGHGGHNDPAHADGEACGCGGHGGHNHPAHADGEACGCGGHGDHNHPAHADEVFSSFGVETARAYSQAALAEILTALDAGTYGTVLRAKGIVFAQDGTWLHFDFVPGEQNIRPGSADVTGRICVIGTQLDEAALRQLFVG